MDSFVAPDHPTEEFAFFVVGELSSTTEEHCEDLIVRLETARDWALGPPQFLDEFEDPKSLPPGTPPLRTLGGVLTLYSSLPPWILPREVELRHYHEVVSVLEALKELSLREGLRFGISLRGEEIGEVHQGEIGRSLREGLLRPWQQHLGQSQDL